MKINAVGIECAECGSLDVELQLTGSWDTETQSFVGVKRDKDGLDDHCRTCGAQMNAQEVFYEKRR